MTVAGPQWLIRPRDTHAPLGSDVMLGCSAISHMTVTFTWYYQVNATVARFLFRPAAQTGTLHIQVSVTITLSRSE